jgi:hypothetical protein
MAVIAGSVFAADWPSYGGDNGSRKYSELDQINASNPQGKLRLDCLSPEISDDRKSDRIRAERGAASEYAKLLFAAQAGWLHQRGPAQFAGLVKMPEQPEMRKLLETSHAVSLVKAIFE